MKKNSIIIASVLFAGILVSSFFLFNRQEEPPIFGTYRPDSTDPQLAILYKAQNISLQVNEDHLIVYSTFLMGKPLHHIQGAFTLNTKTNTLNINWFGGKLPNHLKIEKGGDDYIIRIGETVYKREKKET